MTITSVKDQSSLLNMVGTRAANKADSTKNDLKFGEMMTKAGEQSKTDIGKDDPQLKKTETPKAEKPMDSGMRPKMSEGPGDGAEVQKPQETEEISPEDIEKIEGAIEQVVSVIAEGMGVPAEEVLNAAETLEIEPAGLIDTKNIGDIVLTLSEETDPMALVTNEELFTKVQDLTAAVDAIVEDLAEDMDIEISDVSKMVEVATERPEITSEMQMSVEADSEPKVPVEQKATEEPMERISVTIKTAGRDAEVETDDKGNVLKTETVAPKEEIPTEALNQKERGAEHQEDDGRETRGRSEEHHSFAQTTIQNNNLNMEVPVKEPEVPAEQSYLSEESREIMDQVRNGIRADLRPDMDELELSLHPASLGNVKINLINKGGEITAEFKVQNEMVRDIIEGQIGILRESLRENGVKVEAVEVSVETQSFEENLWQGGQQSGGSTDEERTPGGRRVRRLNLDEIEEDDADLTEEEALAAEMMAANGNTVDYTA